MERGGFSFENVQRNMHLAEKGLQQPKHLKTGTTIVGIVYKDGVILGADTRATEGPIVADKNCEKIHYIAPNIYCCGAGTAADTEYTTALISSKLNLMRLQTKQESRVVTAMTRLKQMLFKYQGHVSAALILGGVDATGPHLYSIWPHGSTDKANYVTMGSGSLAAMGIFEASYKEGMDEEEGKKLVMAAIHGGIFNDLGSGSNVDMLVIRKDGSVENLRNYDKPNPVPFKKEKPYEFVKGSLVVIDETIKVIEKEQEVVEMETD